MTNTEIIQYVQAHLGGERKSGLMKPLILAIANLAYQDLAHHLLETNSELAKKLVTTAVNQTWASSQFSAPADMLFTRQKETTRIDFGGTLAYQLEDRDKLDMISTMANHYYALEGKTFFIKHSAGTTGASNLNITYYKIPVNSDIDGELTPIFLDFLMKRLVPSHKQNEPEQSNN